jgi:hypothetical protein
MNAFKSIAAAALLSVTPVLAHATSVTIDDFSVDQFVEITNGTISDTVSDAGIYGGDRAVSLTATSGTGNPGNKSAISVFGGEASVGNASGQSSVSDFLYTTTSFDLTDSGSNTGIAINMSSLLGSFDFDLTLTDSLGGNFTSSQTVATNGFLTFVFSNFTTAGVDVTDVTSLLLRITSNAPGSDVTFDFIEASDLTPPSVPLPAGGVLLGSILLGGAFVAKRRKNS